MPPTAEIRRLADDMTAEIIKIAKEKDIGLTRVFEILDDINLEILDRYGNPVTDKMVEIFKRRCELSNGWGEAMSMVKRDIRHRIIAENSKTYVGRVLNYLKP